MPASRVFARYDLRTARYTLTVLDGPQRGHILDTPALDLFDVEFHVLQGGAARPAAGLTGYWVASDGELDLPDDGAVPVAYSPESGAFVRRDDATDVQTAAYARVRGGEILALL